MLLEKIALEVGILSVLRELLTILSYLLLMAFNECHNDQLITTKMQMMENVNLVWAHE